MRTAMLVFATLFMLIVVFGYQSLGEKQIMVSSLLSLYNLIYYGIDTLINKIHENNNGKPPAL